MSNHCTLPDGSTFDDDAMEPPHDNYERFIEPRHLTIGTYDIQDKPSHTTYACDSLLPLGPDNVSTRGSGSVPQDYSDIDFRNYPSSPGHLVTNQGHNVDFQDGRGPFSWTEDYGTNTLGSSNIPSLLDDWGGSQYDQGHELGYEHSGLPQSGLLAQPFPGVDGLLGFHHLNTSGPLPPLHSFAPASPFMCESNCVEGFPSLMDSFHLDSPLAMHVSQPRLFDGVQLPPPLPSINNNSIHGRMEDCYSPKGPPTTTPTLRKPRADKRNSKPITVEDLAHDNSRFAKVVKAFLSIEDPESRTVPEIAKRVGDLYAGQYADFEGVKRMVNDVLQKHKAFWHPGRGSPYQLTLAEGRARREFPSNSKHQVRSHYDENTFCPSKSGKRKKSKQAAKGQKRARYSKTEDMLQPGSFRGSSQIPEQLEDLPVDIKDDINIYPCAQVNSSERNNLQSCLRDSHLINIHDGT
ncbi:hypothetical protein DFH11DRAFT_514787 [Phellopilus nigrolimitatus]|nr:hypothetical protein DFH11DRAFT_514787 [Phellopilus nigrolimitatus]